MAKKSKKGGKKAPLLQKRKSRRALSSKGSRKSAPSSRKEKIYSVNKDFEFLNELQSLVLKASPIEPPALRKDLKKIGRIKLAIMSGAFLGVDTARVDLLVVGENIKLVKLFEFIHQKEMELGRELRYVILSPDEFAYRYDMFDHFLKDILEAPHQKVINTLRIS